MKTHQFHNELSHIWEKQLDTYLRIYKPKQEGITIIEVEHGTTQITRLVPSHNPDIGSEYDMHMANEITHAVTGETINMRKLLLNPETQPDWQKGNSNEYGRLFQGHKCGVKGTCTCFFIDHKAVPKGRHPTYVKFVCAYKPHNPIPIECG
jgi:hypothetical protein